MTVWYCPIEPYQERYTGQLMSWTITALRRANVFYQVVHPPLNQHSDNTITTGVALDAHARTLWGLDQTAMLIRLLLHGDIAPYDVIYFQDLYQPGYDALLYVLQQQFPSPTSRPRIFTWCHAQTFDPDDFTHSWPWMRDYERMVGHTARTTFVSATGLKEFMDVAGYPGPVEVVGHPFDSAQVRALAGGLRPLESRPNRIVWSSRFDHEKNPHFFLDMVPALRDLGFEVAILSGGRFRSNDPSALARARDMERLQDLHILEMLTKAQYYGILGDSVLQVNTARQDWVSYTLLEASALGTPTLAPAFRSFPEALFENERCLFVPWSFHDALQKVQALVSCPPTPAWINKPAAYHDGSLDRIISHLVGAAA